MSDEIIIVPRSGLVETGPSALEVAGQAATQAAQHAVFEDYRRGKAANTAKAQLADLERFATFLGEAGVQLGALDLYNEPPAWRGMTWGLVKAFRAWQLQQGFSPSSLNRALSTVRTYASLAFNAGCISAEEMQQISSVRGYSSKEISRLNREKDDDDLRIGYKKAQPTPVDPQNVNRLKQSRTESPLDLRDTALIYILLELGFRVGEVAALNMEDFALMSNENGEYTAGTVSVWRQKTQTRQTHRLNGSTLKALHAYLGARGREAGPLLLTCLKNGEIADPRTRLSVRSINHRIGVLGAEVGLELSPHDLRHTWATRVIRGGSPINAIQQAGGWSSPTMVLRYAVEQMIANEEIRLD